MRQASPTDDDIRSSDISTSDPTSKRELLEFWNIDGAGIPVRALYGKPLDVGSFKRLDMASYAKQVEDKRQSVRAWLTPGNVKPFERCPVCELDLPSSLETFAIHAAAYAVCPVCGHCFLRAPLTGQALARYFAEDAGYRGQYTNPETARFRVERIALPKLHWTQETYSRQFGEAPRRVLDVGAGAGHFVAACQAEGVAVKGMELSPEGVAFARQALGVTLDRLDFLDSAPGKLEGGYDVITMWGVLECVVDARAMVEKAVSLLDPARGMLVIEVPRLDCLSTLIQRLCPESVIRHLDPIGHVHIFTNESLARLLMAAGLTPMAAWYFGMDACELFCQLAHNDRSPALGETSLRAMGPLQQLLDQSGLSDEIVLAATFGRAERSTRRNHA